VEQVFILSCIIQNLQIKPMVSLFQNIFYRYKKDNLEYTVENAIKSFEQMRKNVEKQLDEEQAFFLEKISELVTYYGKDEAGIELRLPNILAQRLIEAVSNTAIIITHPKRKKIKFLQQRKKDSEDYTIDFRNNEYSSETTTSLFLTISAGISCFSPKDTSYLECFKRTDAALYESKNTGKNKYTILY